MYSNSDTPSVSFSRSGFLYQFRSRAHSNHAAIVIFLSLLLQFHCFIVGLLSDLEAILQGRITWRCMHVQLVSLLVCGWAS